jgi:hypothetical protein
MSHFIVMANASYDDRLKTVIGETVSSFETLIKAQMAMVKLKANHPDTHYTILIREGTRRHQTTRRRI